MNGVEIGPERSDEIIASGNPGFRPGVPCWDHVDVSENSGTPKSSRKKFGFPLFSPSILRVFPLIFGNTHVEKKDGS